MTDTTFDDSPPSILDRTIDLTRVGWVTIGAVVVIAIGVALRFAQLDVLALSPVEGRRAFQAYSFYRGSTSGPAFELPDTSPAFLLLQSFALFLFGATDVVARVVPAILGSGIVVLAWLMAPFVGRARALGMAVLAALSPTLLYASRTADVEIAVAFFSLLVVVAVLRIGLADASVDARRTWTLVAGIALAAVFASGPSSISVLLSLGVGLIVGLAFETGRDGALRRSLDGMRSTPQAPVFAIAGFVLTLIVLFTRLFSDLTALSGIGATFADWGRLVATASSTTPTQFFLLATLLYEPLAIAFAIVAANRGLGDRRGALSWPFFIGWFTAALLVFSFSSGRAPEQVIHVALPLVLLAGAGLGDLFSSLDLSPSVRNRAGTLFAAVVGLVVAIVALAVLIERIDTVAEQDQNRAVFQAIAVGVLAVVPLAFAVYSLTRGELAAGTGRQAGFVALAVLALFLGGYTIRSTALLSYYNAGEGTELLAQRTSTPAVDALVNRLQKLSRDATVTDGSPRDPTGGHGLSIAIDRRVQWPYRWYFRDYPDAQVVANGQAPESGTQVVIAPDDAGMPEAGYTPRTYPTLNRVPAIYTAPNVGTVLKNILFPSHWSNGVDFLILRDLDVTAPPESIAVGLNAELANRVFPNTGPFSLVDRAGSGSGRGQFNGPRGIAVAPDSGTTYVVDMGNARVERFDELGQFIGAWGGEDGGVAFERTEAGLGPTGITVSADGQTIYVCDTWNHRIVVLDHSGQMVREIGSFKDTQDSPDPTIDTGFFFGPRDVAVTADEIYVVDTGNERVQVFGLDGTFKRAFGGSGSEPGQLVEPVGIALGPDGRVYVADSGNARIAVFAADGTPLEQWPVDTWSGQQYFEPYLAFDQDGNLYATSSQTGSVEVLDNSGQLVESIQQVGSESLQAPIGITSAPDGSLLITDTRRSAVLRYSAPAPSLIPENEEIIDELPASPAAATPEGSPAANPIASPAASPTAESQAG
ncbi:MAG: hypothetical protein QOG89_2130 [Thermomicrobiales bacterium]|nr:hypothetical protein [Thermomicrobiales bacterium]